MLVRLCAETEIAEAGLKGFTVEGRQVVLGGYAGSFYAVERRCGHKGAALDKGSLAGYILTCPLHFAQFDITTGEALSGPVPSDGQATRSLKTYPVKKDNGALFLELADSFY